MGFETVLWTLAATLFGGIQAFVQKVIAHEGRSNGLNGAFMFAGPGVVALVTLAFAGIPVSWQMIALYAALSGVMYAIGNYLRIEGIKHIDTVIYFPLNKVLGPLLVVTGSVLFLGESLTQLQMLGIALSISVPILLISSSEKHRQNNLALGLVFLIASTLFTSASAIVSKLGLSFDSPVVLFVAVSQFTGFVLSMGIHVRSSREEGHVASLTKRRDWELGMLAAVLSVAAVFTLYKATSLGQLSLVYTIHAHFILIPILLSVWWYKEHINTRKLFAVVVSFVAIGLLI